MAIDPLTIGLMAAGGLARGIGGAVGTMAGGRAAFGDAQQQRLAELRRMEEMGALGLTSEEQAQLQQIALDPVRAANRERMERAQALMASQGAMQSGDALANLMRRTDAEARQMDEATQKVMAADIARQRDLEKEMRALEQSESVRAASGQAALGAFLGGLGGAADAAVQYQAYQDAAARRNIAADATISPETAEKLENF